MAMQIPTRLLLLLILLHHLPGYSQERIHKIFVPANGSIPQAIKEADKIATGTKPPQKIEIILSAGTYFIDSTIGLTQGATWHSNIPLTIRSATKTHATLHGGRIVPVKKVKQVNDPAFLAGLEPEARKQVRMLDLEDLGIKNLGQLRPVGFSRPFGVAWMEPFFNKKPGTLARWPNDSMILIGKLIDSGSIARNGDYSLRSGVFTYEGTDRPSRWREASKAWIAGYFMWGYADDAVPLKSIDTLQKKITTALPTMYGFGTGKPYRAFYAYNIPEEIDTTGEYYLDKDKQRLYFIPPANLKTIELSILEQPMMALEGVANIRIEGLDFTCSRSMGIYMERTTGVRINHCSFSNLGMMAVSMGKGIIPEEGQIHTGSGTPASRIVGNIIPHVYDNSTFDREGGTNNGFENCRVFQTGAGGIFMTGGNRLTLEPGNSFVKNCYFSNYNRIEKSYRPGIWITGVGNHISNCEVCNGPAMGILLHGNDHLVEYNNIHHMALVVDDMGAFYHGRDPSERGNIIRYNYFHHIGSKHKTEAVYHDDGECGTTVYGNVFYKAGTVAGFIGGGRDNHYDNNIFIDIRYASHIDDRLNNWAKAMLDSNGLFRKRLNAVGYNRPPYSTRYPHLKDYFEDDPALPKRDTFTNNILVRIGKITEGKKEWLPFTDDNLVVDHDPGFIDSAKEDFRIKESAEVWKKLPNFRQIPFWKIGYDASK
ncbi:MAG TPA: right-handed parallel beta-helix repeat-containing protein [Puia sp.]|nr:right-handed parallel beta-helix repeat-containing protein [Puia sp.]